MREPGGNEQATGELDERKAGRECRKVAERDQQREERDTGGEAAERDKHEPDANNERDRSSRGDRRDAAEEEAATGGQHRQCARLTDAGGCR